MNQATNSSTQSALVNLDATVLLKLGLIELFLQELHTNEIMYCHWKSNEHLDASMLGNTDLDILFAVTQQPIIETIFQKFGFKKLDAIRQKQYVGIEDYIGLDHESGKIIHVHTHYTLTMGESFLKSYQLNVEERLLTTRVFDSDYNIYRTDPAMELILLYFRAAFKLRSRDRLKLLMHKNISYSGGILNEYYWLKLRCTDSQVADHLQTMFKDHLPIYQLITAPFNRITTGKLAKLLKSHYSSQRLYHPLTANLRRWYRELYLKNIRRLNNRVNYPIPVQRINPRGGLIVAVIGADGSGKSTVINNLDQTFKKKLDVYKIYFGMGGGKMSWYRYTLKKMKQFTTLLGRKTANGTRNNVKSIDIEEKSNNQRVNKSFSANLFKCVEALMVAIEKKANLQRMQLAKKRGMLVLCDRFPQNTTVGYNDGPSLSGYKNSGNPLWRAMAKQEARMYDRFTSAAPDVLFKLIADARVIEARKPGQTGIEILKKKIEGIKSLQFMEPCQVITVNAEVPIEEVLKFIKQKIWELNP
jgi:thymidylate kinase